MLNISLNVKSLLAMGVLTGLLGLTACKTGGEVTATSTAPVPTAIISAPIIAMPATSPYYSKDSHLSISGICMPGSIVYLSGSALDQQVCNGGIFAFGVDKPTDGLYTFLVTQSNPAQYYSNPAALVWFRKTSVPPPIITYPATSPFYSGLTSLTITGSCETGSTISLSNGGAGSTVCANSGFSITLPKAADGDYTIAVNQTDSAGNTAASSFVWSKKTLLVTPTEPSLTVNVPYEIHISGGSGSFTVTQVTNASGGSYNHTTNFYTPGTLAGVVDVLRVDDAFGNSILVHVTTIAGAADHFVLAAASGDAQTGYIGTPLALPLGVRVVDAYGNGIAAVPVFFQSMIGDATVTSNPIQVSDATGLVQASVTAGYHSVLNGILASAVSGPLPDTLSTGKGTITLTSTTLTKNTGAFGSTFAVGSNPGQMISGDFNGDGLPDVAILNIHDSKLGILMNAGGGLYRTMVNYSICLGPSSLTSGVFDKVNNKLDILVVCSASNQYSLVRGNGDGSFKTPLTSAVASSQTIPTAVVSGDFNGDGKLDFALTSAGAGVVGVYFGDGLGAFATSGADEYLIGQTPTAIKTIDVDGQGRVDLIISNAGSNNVSVLKNRGNGKFYPQSILPVGPNPVGLVVGQFTADTYQDFATVNDGNGSVTVYKNDRTGSFEQAPDVFVGTNPTSLATGDFNKDGFTDLVVTNGGDSTLTILHGANDGTFIGDPAIPTTDSPLYVIVADIDKDLQQDLLITGGANAVMQVLQGQPGGVNFGLVTLTGVSPSDAAFADIDNDGIPDAIVVNKGSNSVSIFKGKGNGFFTLLSTKTTGNSPTSIAVGDFNRDGALDFAVTNSSGSTLSLFMNLKDGLGGFAAATFPVVGSNPVQIKAVDINRDGYLDLVTANSGAGTVSVLLNDPAHPGVFFLKSDFAVGSAPSGLAIGDFNGDHYLDVAVTSSSTDTVTVRLGNGDGTFRLSVGYTIGTSLGPIAIVSADLNNDGFTDLITANSTDHTISVLLANADGSFRPFPATYEANPSPVGLVVGDFNKDGKLDVAVANSSNKTFTIIRGNGNGTFTSSPSTFNPNTSIGGLISGDFNQDGALDLMLFDTFNAKVLLWQGQ